MHVTCKFKRGRAATRPLLNRCEFSRGRAHDLDLVAGQGRGGDGLDLVGSVDGSGWICLVDLLGSGSVCVCSWIFLDLLMDILGSVWICRWISLNLFESAV